MKELAKQYDPSQVEDRIYQFWLDGGYFHTKADPDKKPYTIVTGRSVGAPVRVLKNRMSREYVRQEKAGADKMELEKYTLGSLRRAVFEGDTVSGSLMAGQVAGMLHEVRPVADILADLWQGGRQRIAALNTEC